MEQSFKGYYKGFHLKYQHEGSQDGSFDLQPRPQYLLLVPWESQVKVDLLKFPHLLPVI